MKIIERAAIMSSSEISSHIEYFSKRDKEKLSKMKDLFYSRKDQIINAHEEVHQSIIHPKCKCGKRLVLMKNQYGSHYWKCPVIANRHDYNPDHDSYWVDSDNFYYRNTGKWDKKIRDLCGFSSKDMQPTLFLKLLSDIGLADLGDKYGRGKTTYSSYKSGRDAARALEFCFEAKIKSLGLKTIPEPWIKIWYKGEKSHVIRKPDILAFSDSLQTIFIFEVKESEGEIDLNQLHEYVEAVEFLWDGKGYEIRAGFLLREGKSIIGLNDFLSINDMNSLISITEISTLEEF